MNNFLLFFFDWDGTLCSDRFWKSIRGKDTNVSRAIDNFFLENKKLLKEWMLGKMTSEEVNKIISEESGFPYDLLWDTFIKDCENIFFEPILREELLKLRKQAKTVLITGNMDCFRRFIIPVLKLEDCFDAIIISSESGMLKDENEGEQFKKIVQSFNVPIDRSVLIDDSEKCCSVFDKIGGYSIKTSSPDNTIKIVQSLYEKNCF